MNEVAETRSNGTRSEVRDGMRIDWNAPIPMDDGIVLRADVFRPIADGRYAVVLSYGPYGKGLSFQEFFKSQWDRMVAAFPETAQGSSNKYQNWEVVDPEKWVPDGFICVRVDSRGAGRSPGVLDHHNPREARDLYDCIEWAAAQPWSNGKVGLNGISYYAMNQWRVAGLQPPHLAAICVWEGYADRYRDATHHGGILSTFARNFQGRQVFRVQHGVGERGPRNPVTGDLVSGPETLPEAELVKKRGDLWGEVSRRPLDGPYYRDRSADWEKITVPLLSAGNWGGHGLHLRGNVEGFMRAASKQKWLEIHGQAHWTHFYTNYGIDLQKRFLGHFLKGENTGWDKQPPVQLQIRHPGERFVLRYENEWPIARTEWTKFYLVPDDRSLARDPPPGKSRLDYEALGDGLMFLTAPFERETEITGPAAAKLFVSSSTSDADIFLVLRLFDAGGKEVLFHGANDPKQPIAFGWLRASHRKLDPELSRPYRPYHAHDEKWPLTPGEPAELDVEIWPTSIVIPPGYRLGLAVRGKDYQHDEPPVELVGVKYTMHGVGPFKHDEPSDRPPEIFAGTTTLHFAPDRQAYVLLPVVPPKAG
ncbi:MAG TPA: CocE/NonD family hydrolase [Xanthobacteraceae bacterium]|nr:CocE/NonD family hydrolase [Xanthobacteraceae bacterium]